MERIVSENNPRVKHLIQLETKGKVRRQTGSFVEEGIRLFMDTPDDRIEETYVSAALLNELEQEPAGTPVVHGEAAPGRADAILGKLKAHDAVVLDDRVFRRAADTAAPQGILAVVRQPSWTLEDVLGMGSGRSSLPAGRAEEERPAAVSPLVLVTEHVQDPGNLGTMFRTAEAAGATGIIMTGDTVDLFQPKTVRATMSAIFRVPFMITDDLQSTLRDLGAAGVKTYAAALDGQQDYDACSYIGGTAFLIGNEGNGLRPETSAAADEKIRIPMEGSIESLNAAMSAGVLMYEAHRQRYHVMQKEEL